jgi:hypothetical protein
LLIVVHSKAHPELAKAIMCKWKVNPAELSFSQGEGGWWTVHDRDGFSVKLPQMFNGCFKRDLQCFQAITSFNEFHIADLEFCSNALGQRNSASCHCVKCRTKGKDWGTNQIKEEDIRMKDSQLGDLVLFKMECFCKMMKKLGHVEIKSKYMTKDGKKLKTGHLFWIVPNAHAQKAAAGEEVDLQKNMPNNNNGVNALDLLGIDPKWIVTPPLHCPMGLTNKLLEDMEAYLLLYAEPLSDPTSLKIWKNFLQKK